MKATSDRILTAIFCDDIRQEVGNKMSFMGCYQSELVVPTAPIALSKLCIFVTALTPTARPFKSLTLRVVLDERTELARMNIPSESLASLAEVQDDSATRQLSSTAMMFSPFIIENPSILRVFADTEEGEIIGPRLLIKVAPEMVSAVVAPSSQAPSSVAKKKPRRNKTLPAK